MRVLFLTWEFPPLISGGLGTACYGMVRSLLGRGVEIDLVLPAREEVYFKLRSPRDADELPVSFLSASAAAKEVERTAELIERLELVGVSAIPETYLSPAASHQALWTELARTSSAGRAKVFARIERQLLGGERLFRKVQEMADRVQLVADRLDFDLIHAHDWLTYPAGLALAELSGKPLVAHIHATEFDRAGGVGDERIHQIEYAGLSAADTVIAVSRYTAEMVINRYRIWPAKMRVVHNAFDLPPVRLADKRRIFKHPLVLYLGRITVQKGPDYFLEVARRVLKRHPKTQFVMAGAGDMMRSILHRSASMRLRQRFLFTDFLNRRQVEEILKAADIFIMPSVSEPFGIVPLEAMAHGAAAIISKQSGVAEVLTNVHKVDFWDVDQMVDLVCRLIEDPEERLALARAGQEEVSRIQWDEAAEKIEAVYAETLETAGRR